MTPFLNLNRQIFQGEIMVLAAHVVYVEITQSRSASQIVLGLTSGQTIESHVFEPNDQTIVRLREIRDEIANDLIARLQRDDKPSYAQLPPAGA